jgi:hypothetical protein
VLLPHLQSTAEQPAIGANHGRIVRERAAH